MRVSEGVEWLMRQADDINIVMGPVCWRPQPENAEKRRWYFMVAYSHDGFQCLEIRADSADDIDMMRIQFGLALFKHRPLVVHDTDDELGMARLCETLWPGERITTLRKAVEAEYTP